MNIRRLLCCVFLLLATFGGAIKTAHAADDSPQIMTDGACQITEENKKEWAKQAIDALRNSQNRLNDYNSYLNKIWYADDGSCHFLKGTSTSKWWQEAFTKVLNYDSHARSGAVVIDKNKWGFLKQGDVMVTIADVVDKFNEYSTHTDWDPDKIVGRVTKGVNNIKQISSFIKTAKEGQWMEVDEAASEILEEAFGYSVDCRYIKMTDDNGNFLCSQMMHWADKDGKTLTDKAVDVAGVVTDAAIEVSGYGGQVINNAIGTGDMYQKGEDLQKDVVKGSMGILGDAADLAVTGAGKLAELTGVTNAFTSSRNEFDQIVAKKLGTQMEQCPADLQKLSQLRTAIKEPNARTDAHKYLDLLSGELDVRCKCKVDENGGGTEEIDSCTAINTDFQEDTLQKCPTIANYQERMGGPRCVICNLFHVILKAVQNVASASFNELGKPLSMLVGLGFLLYIGYITLLAVAAPATQKLSQFLNNLTTQGFKVAIAIFLLTAPSAIYNYGISPLIDGGIEFGINLTQEDRAKIEQFGRPYAFDDGNEYLKTPVLRRAVGAAAAFNDAALRIPAIGRSMICNSWLNLGLNVFPAIQIWLTGIILYVFGLAISYAIGFYMLDCALQLGIVCAMLPFFIACWPFAMTRTYTKQGWNIFLNTFFNFVVMGVVISATAAIITQAISTGLNEDTLINYLNANNIEGLAQEIDLGGLAMVMLVICCCIGFKLSGEIQNITNKLAGGLGIGIGAGMGGTLASSQTKIAAGGIQAGWSGIKAAGKSIGQNSGLTGAAKALGGKISGKAGAIAGAAGIGAQAQMLSKGRDDGKDNTQGGDSGGGDKGGDSGGDKAGGGASGGDTGGDEGDDNA